MQIDAWHRTYQNYTYKIFVLQKKAIRAINNLAYNEIPTHTSNVIISLNFLISINLKFRNTFFNYYTPILMKK